MGWNHQIVFGWVNMIHLTAIILFEKMKEVNLENHDDSNSFCMFFDIFCFVFSMFVFVGGSQFKFLTLNG